MAVATDVGGWRVLEPVLAEPRLRCHAPRAMLAGKAAEYARRDGIPHEVLGGQAESFTEQADRVIRTEPAGVLLGTSVGEVVEWEVARRARGRIPTLGVLDAMLFVERRFGERLEALPDVVACPDLESGERLIRAGARREQVVVTGNPTLELIGATQADGGPPTPGPAEPVDVLFVSQPVASIGDVESPFAIDERRSLDDLLALLGELRDLAPAGARVRVRWHPVQRPDRLPSAPTGVTAMADDDEDRFRSARRASVVVGLSSTLLAEARMLPRAAIAYLPGPYWDREPVYAAEQGVRIARSPDDLRRALDDALGHPPTPAPRAAHAGAVARVADLAERMLSGAPV